MTTIQTSHGEIIAIQTVGGYDLLINGKTVAYADKRAGIFRVYGRSFLTIEKAAAYVAKTYEPAPEPAKFENEVDADFLEERVLNACEIGSHLADEQAKTECEAYCAMQYEEEEERACIERKHFNAQEQIQEYENDVQILQQMLELYEKCNTLVGLFYTDMRDEIKSQIAYCNEGISTLRAWTKTPAKTITGLADGTAKIVLITGENELIPARKICRVCGGEAKDSTALVHDFLNDGTNRIWHQDKLATRRAVCLKCKECGHSWQEGK